MRRLRWSEIEGLPDEIRPPLPVEARGKGPALVLFHGYGLDARTYRRAVALLGRRCRVVVPRWLGTESPWTYHGTLSATAAALDELGVEEATLLGHSFGGALALGFAARYPARVRHLIEVNSNGLETHWQLAREALPGLLHAYRLATPTAATDFFRSWASRPDAMVRAAWWGFNCRKDAEVEAVRRAAIPCDVLWSERDTLISRESADRFARRLGATFTVVDDPEGAGPVDHSWPFRNPELLMRWLDELGLIPQPLRRDAETA